MSSALSGTRAFLILRYTLIVATAYLLLVEREFAMPSPGILLLIVAALASNVVIALTACIRSQLCGRTAAEWHK